MALERPYYTRAGHKLYPGILNYSLVGLNLCRSRHLRTRDGVGMPHARSGGDALSAPHFRGVACCPTATPARRGRVVFLVACPEGRGRVRETFELNQLKSGPSQLLPGFFQNLTGCKLVAINLDWPISYIPYKLTTDIGQSKLMATS
jgi:hypothetical protein